jgi:hypothetical protein
VPHALTLVTSHAATLATPRAVRCATDTSELDRIGEEIATLAAHVHAATYQLLVLLAEFDGRGGWGGGGFRSCAHWLSWRTGIAAGAAREKVRSACATHTAARERGDAHRRAVVREGARDHTRSDTRQ